MPLRRFVVLFAVVALPFCHAGVRADCGASELRTCNAPSLTGYHDFTFTFSTPAARESANACFSCPFAGNLCEGFTNGPRQVVQFDIPAGVVYASYSGAGALYSPSPLEATSRDLYWIVGPPSADPIACTARFEVGGYGTCRSAGALSMTVGSQSVAASYDNGVTMGPCGVPPPVAGALSAPVSALPDQSFDITLSARITTPPLGGNAYAYGRLVFVDLPPGYTVVSCNGFGGLATPALDGSWGRLKVRYR